MPSPQTPAIDLIGSAAAPATIATTYSVDGTSSSIDVSGHIWAVYSIFVDALGTATRIDVSIEESPDGTNWAALQTESVSSGVATLSNYEQQKAASGTGLLFTSHAPVRGGAYQRIKVKANTGTTTTIHVQYTLSGS